VCQTKLEKHARDKHSSLLRKFVNYGQKSFITLAPGLRVFGGNGPAFRKGKYIFCHTTHSIKHRRDWFLSLLCLSYYDISLLYSRIHLKWISLCYCAKSWRQKYLQVDLTLKTTPPPIFLDPVSRSDQTYFCTI
jgi:hypothetical protein